MRCALEVEQRRDAPVLPQDVVAEEVAVDEPRSRPRAARARRGAPAGCEALDDGGELGGERRGAQRADAGVELRRRRSGSAARSVERGAREVDPRERLADLGGGVGRDAGLAEDLALDPGKDGHRLAGVLGDERVRLGDRGRAGRGVATPRGGEVREEAGVAGGGGARSAPRRRGGTRGRRPRARARRWC